MPAPTMPAPAQPYVPVPARQQFASMPTPGASMPFIQDPVLAELGKARIMDSPSLPAISDGRVDGPSEKPMSGPEAVALLEQKQELIDFLEAEVERLSQPIPNELEERVAFLEKLLSGVDDSSVPVHAPIMQELQKKNQGKRYVGHLAQSEGGVQEVAYDGMGRMPTLA